MTKLQMTELHKLSVKDKIKVVPSLWDDIAKEQTSDTISVEHKKILEERLQKINSGTAIFKPWSEIQNKFKQF
jgi:putative addiction module component (TIGR02574 family)